MSPGAGGALRARALVAECLLGVAEPRPRLAALAAEPVDWPSVARLAWAAMAEETVAHALLDAGLPLDRPGREPLLDAYQNASAKNALLLRDAAEIQGALRSAGVESVALKGIALVAAHYPALGARHVGDLDLLVAAGDLGRVREVLAALGMRQPIPDTGTPPPGDGHLHPWVTRGGLACEIHVRLPGAPEGAAEGVRDRSRVVAWRGQPLRIPCPADLAGIASVHALRHHAHDRRFRPRLVADLAVLGSEPGLRDEARRLHGPTVEAAFALLASVRAGRVGAAVPRRLGTPVDDLARRAGGLAAALSRASRHGRLRALFFPDRPILARRYGFAESAPLLPLLYAWRPFAAIVRVLSGR